MGGGFGHAVLDIGVAEPGGDIGELFEGFRIEGAFHDAAVGVAADDDFRDAQDAGGVFQGGGDAADGLRIRRDDVADDAADEEFAGFGLGEEAGVNAGICAGDEESVGTLAQGEFFEEVLVLGVNVFLEAGNASEKFVDGHYPYFRIWGSGVRTSLAGVSSSVLALERRWAEG